MAHKPQFRGVAVPKQLQHFSFFPLGRNRGGPFVICFGGGGGGAEMGAAHLQKALVSFPFGFEGGGGEAKTI